MGYASGTTITCYVHGDKSPYSKVHHSPNIYLKFKATTSRNGTAVTVSMTNMVFKALGGYGYPLTVYVNVASTGWKTIDKSTATSAVTWTRRPDNKTITVSSFSGTEIPIAIAAYSSDKKKCYGTSKKTIATYKFNVPAASCVLTYDANGGTNAPAAVTVAAGGTASITEEKPYANTVVNYVTNPPQSYVVYTDTIPHTFLRWNTKADGTGTSYSATDPQYPSSITLSANTTLYAQWGTISYEIKPYKDPLGIDITFNPMGGTVVPTVNHISYTQLGYAEGTYWSSPHYQPGTTYSFSPTTLTLYPKYAEPYTSVVTAADLPPELTGSTLYNLGYTFLGWYLDQGLTNPIVVPYTTPVDFTLYAKWKALPVYKKTDDDWTSDTDSFVWKCVEVTEGGTTTKVWQRVAHVFKCTEDSQQNKSWKDIST